MLMEGMGPRNCTDIRKKRGEVEKKKKSPETKKNGLSLCTRNYEQL